MRRPDPVGRHNERVKLLAGSVNTIGLGAIALGVVRPFIDPLVDLDLVSAASVGVALALHVLAHYILGRVETDK